MLACKPHFEHRLELPPAMSLLALSLAYIRARALNAALNLVLLALGVGMIVLLLLFSAQLEDRLTRDARGIDLVIGSKGSPLQLILSSIYHVDFPTGNIPLAEAERWAEHPLVAEAMPLALGDNLAGFRIVGAEHAYALHYGPSWLRADCGRSRSKRLWGAGRRQHRVGHRRPLRRQPRPCPGGPVHGEHPYTVVGVLEPTASGLDRLVHGIGRTSVALAHGIVLAGARREPAEPLDAPARASGSWRPAMTSARGRRAGRSRSPRC